MEEVKELSKHELKELRRKEKEEQIRLEEEKIKSKKTKKNVIKYSIIGLVVLLVFYFLFNLFSGPKVEFYTKEAIHWHASYDVYICGKKVQVPENLPSGEHHLGLPLLHTHADGLIHIEGKIYKKEDITFGAYMDAIGVPFNTDMIMEYKNDGMCNDGKNNKVRVLINGEENVDPRNYVVRDKDRIEVRYE